MAETTDVAVLVGSLRRASYTRKVARALIAGAPPGLRCREIEFADLPIYNEDLEAQAPAPWVRFRNEVAATRAVIFASPEYNRSIPGGLKNAIDVGSRPYGKSVWTAKPAAIITVSPGKIGAFGANHALRQCLVFLDMPAMQQPEAYIGGAAELFDEQDGLKNQETRKFLSDFMTAYAKWIGRVTAT